MPQSLHSSVLDMPQMGSWALGPDMMDAPLLALPHYPSCQQLSKALALTGIRLRCQGVPPCGGSWTGAVLLVLDSQGWLREETEAKQK